MDRQPLLSRGPKHPVLQSTGHYSWTTANQYEIEENKEMLLVSGGCDYLKFSLLW